MACLILKDKGETILSQEDQETYTFDLADMKNYDWLEESVRCVINDLAIQYDGVVTAKLLYMFSKAFLDAHSVDYELYEDELNG